MYGVPLGLTGPGSPAPACALFPFTKVVLQVRSKFAMVRGSHEKGFLGPPSIRTRSLGVLGRQETRAVGK